MGHPGGAEKILLKKFTPRFSFSSKDKRKAHIRETMRFSIK
jgi:hypothetical protein